MSRGHRLLPWENISPIDIVLPPPSYENYCKSIVGTFDSKWPVDGSISKGGYAKYWRGQGHLVVPIPAGLPSDVAAPMLCGGITAFSPLTQHGAGPGKRVGIVGTGATAIQVVPQLARHAAELYVFQRTPCAVFERRQRPTDPEEWRSRIAAKPGWQRERLRSFAAVLSRGALSSGKAVQE